MTVNPDFLLLVALPLIAAILAIPIYVLAKVVTGGLLDLVD
jgi:hypothetical protein